METNPSILTSAQFARLTGRNTAYICTYAKRGNLVRTPEGTYDLTNPTNAKVFEQWRSEYLLRISSPEGVAEYEAKGVITKPRIKKEPKPAKAPKPAKRLKPSKEPKPRAVVFTPAPPKDDDTDDSYHDLLTKKRIADLRVKEMEYEKKRLEVEKLKGKLLDIDVAKGITQAYISQYAKGLYRDIETWVHKLMDIHKFSLSEKTKHTHDLERLINIASDRAMAEVVKKLESENTQL